MMRRIKLTIAYDGTNYCGWQIQNNGPSVEGMVDEALARLLPEEKPRITGASRTDSGVHARGNVAVFDTAGSVPAARFAPAVNRYLPPDIRILGSEEVPPEFHPRFTAHTKTYLYQIDNNRIPDPLQRLYRYHYSYPLDLARMQEAAEYLVGEHDFTSFVNPDSQVFEHNGDAVRTIYEISVTGSADGSVAFRISGNGFLYHMIRIIVGTLLQVGTGRRRPEDIPEILAEKDRTAAGPTVPANGLLLQKLDYGDSTERGNR